MSAFVYSDECDVYLCNRPIQHGGSVNLASGALSLVASTTRSVSGDAWNKHWLLVFDYGDDEVLICDADMDAGELTGRRYWKKKAFFLKTYPNKRYLGRHNVPERLLEKYLKKVCDSGRYHLIRNNCQTWALDLLRELGIKAPEEEQPAQKVVDEVILPGATAVAGVLAVVGAGLLAAHYFRGARRNNRE